MKPKQLPPDDPREWIRRANSNLALSGTVLKDVDFAASRRRSIFVARADKFNGGDHFQAAFAVNLDLE